MFRYGPALALCLAMTAFVGWALAHEHARQACVARCAPNMGDVKTGPCRCFRVPDGGVPELVP